MANKKKYNCTKCKVQLGSKAWLTRHENEMHPYIAPPPPKITIEEIPTDKFTQSHSLRNGARTIKVGDSINIDTKYVVRKTKVTEGKSTIEVELEKVEAMWRAN